MAKGIPVPVHPPTLRWAREEMGLSVGEVAEKTAYSIEELRQWENGEQAIELSKAKKLADKYKVSLPLLYLKEIPQGWRVQKPVDFRRLDKKFPYSYQLNLALHTARMRQQWLREFLQEEEEKPLDWLGTFNQEQSSAEIAEYILQWLEVDIEKIGNFRDDKDALASWIRKVEAKRIIVAANSTHRYQKIPHEEYSGLVLYDEFAPLILLNPADSPARRLFTLIHELAHLLLDRQSSLSLIDFRASSDQFDPIESKCNQISSHTLLPRSLLQKYWEDQSDIDTNVRKLAKYFKVSHSAVAVAAKEIQKIKQDQLDKLLNNYREAFLKKASLKRETPSGGRTAPEKQVFDRCGRLLVETVLNAYEKGNISALRIHDILGIKLKYLNRLSAKISFPLSRWQR